MTDLFKWTVAVNVWDSLTTETFDETVEFHSINNTTNLPPHSFCSAVSRALDAGHCLPEPAEILKIVPMGDGRQVIITITEGGTVTVITTGKVMVTLV